MGRKREARLTTGVMPAAAEADGPGWPTPWMGRWRKALRGREESVASRTGISVLLFLICWNLYTELLYQEEIGQPVENTGTRTDQASCHELAIDPTPR